MERPGNVSQGSMVINPAQRLRSVQTQTPIPIVQGLAFTCWGHGTRSQRRRPGAIRCWSGSHAKAPVQGRQNLRDGLGLSLVGPKCYDRSRVLAHPFPRKRSVSPQSLLCIRPSAPANPVLSPGNGATSLARCLQQWHAIVRNDGARSHQSRCLNVVQGSWLRCRPRHVTLAFQ